MPGNVQVTAATPGNLTVTWSPSTDNKWWPGTTLLINGTRRATALGTAPVSSPASIPGPAYTVQVQAFDVKLNTYTRRRAPRRERRQADFDRRRRAPTDVRVLDGQHHPIW